jgi:hypothetical protein
MIQQRLFILTSCFAACFFCSCRESNDSEKADLSVRDSIHEIINDSGTIAGKADTHESIKTDTSSNEPAERFNTLSELNRRLNKRSSHFVIKTNRDTVIKCKEGTLLSIPANAFLNASDQSPVAGEVRISVKEFYRVSDMVIAGLSTTSNNQLLETGGMINIRVTGGENNDSYILKPGKNIAIAMPNSDPNAVDRMQLFNGVHDSTNINWMPQAGIYGLAQGWRLGGNYFSQGLFQLNSEFVFPDETPKVKPALINSKPENLQAEIKISIRDLVQQEGVVTKKANGYIDTSGNLHCYKIGNSSQQGVSFKEIYSPTTYQNTKVNLAVEVNISYKSNLNHGYFQKLFKMGKGKPDSLVTITATLKPAIKIASIEKIKATYEYAITVKEYQKRQKHQALLRREYEKKLKQLQLDNEEKLMKSESNSTTDLQSAQNYLLLSTPSLGWINCDRFYNNPAKVDYFVKLKEKASLLIVFNSIKSIISTEINGIFKSVPLNEKITIVGLKTEEGKLMMAFHETTVTEKPFEQLSFKPVTVKEYKSRLEKLNRL